MAQTTIKQLILKVLKADERLWNKDKTELNQTLLLDLVENIDEKVIDLLLQEKDLREKFFVKINLQTVSQFDPLKGVSYVFKTNDFRFFMEENKVDNSYTAYKNRIGLTDSKKFLKDTNDVILDFPYKDCVLEGGQSTEEGTDTYFEKNDKGGIVNYELKKGKRKEIFFNSVLAHDEIDRLFDAKALTNWKRFTKDGEIPPSISLTPPQEGKDWRSGKFGWDNIHTLPINKNLVDRAKKMAKNMTKAEQIIWFNVLASKQLNFKWVKQKIIDNYIVDFYCHKLGLVVEIDGKTHDEREEYDKTRTRLFNYFELEVIRYSNDEVYNNLEDVKNDLINKIKKRQSQILELTENNTPVNFIDTPSRGGTQEIPLLRGQNAMHFGGIKRDTDGTIKENLMMISNTNGEFWKNCIITLMTKNQNI